MSLVRSKFPFYGLMILSISLITITSLFCYFSAFNELAYTLWLIDWSPSCVAVDKFWILPCDHFCYFSSAKIAESWSFTCYLLPCVNDNNILAPFKISSKDLNMIARFYALFNYFGIILHSTNCKASCFGTLKWRLHMANPSCQFLVGKNKFILDTPSGGQYYF